MYFIKIQTLTQSEVLLPFFLTLMNSAITLIFRTCTLTQVVPDRPFPLARSWQHSPVTFSPLDICITSLQPSFFPLSSASAALPLQTSSSHGCYESLALNGPFIYKGPLPWRPINDQMWCWPLTFQLPLQHKARSFVGNISKFILPKQPHSSPCVRKILSIFSTIISLIKCIILQILPPVGLGGITLLFKKV